VLRDVRVDEVANVLRQVRAGADSEEGEILVVVEEGLYLSSATFAREHASLATRESDDLPVGEMMSVSASLAAEVLIAARLLAEDDTVRTDWWIRGHLVRLASERRAWFVYLACSIAGKWSESKEILKNSSCPPR